MHAVMQICDDAAPAGVAVHAAQAQDSVAGWQAAVAMRSWCQCHNQTLFGVVAQRPKSPEMLRMLWSHAAMLQD